MNKKITRRSFVRGSAALGVSASIGTSGLSKIIEDFVNPIHPRKNIDVSVAVGGDYFESTRKAVEMLGGMSKFVPAKSSVLLLGNVPGRIPGTYTKPDIFRAVARMCRDAGARKITCVSMLTKKSWEKSGNLAVLEEEDVVLKLFDFTDYSQYKRIPIPEGISLTEAEIMKEFFVHDVFINVPICKHHVDTVVSCTMKNLMGLNSFRNNRLFHIEGSGLDIDVAQHLAQCIADLNTVISPTLNIVDATELIATNGPMGPGRVIKPRKVVAGADRIAVDTYCITLLDNNVNDVIKIGKGYKHGLGEMDLSKVRVHEENI